MKKRIFKYVILVLLIGVIGLLLPKCKKDLPSSPGVWEADTIPANAPSISSIDPDTAFGGITITVTGANFNTDVEKNQVAIGTSLITPDAVSSNGTTLTFTTPDGYSDALVDVKVSSVASPYWSNAVSFYFPTFRIIYMVTITPSADAKTSTDKAYIYRTEGTWGENNDYPKGEEPNDDNAGCFTVWSNHRNYVIPSKDSVITDIWMQCADWDFKLATGLSAPDISDSVDVTFAVDMLSALDDVNFDSTGVYITGNIDDWVITPMTLVPLAGQ